MGQPVTWFDIYSSNPQSLNDFYGKVFGWKLQPMEGTDYAIADTDSGQGIGGGIGHRRKMPVTRLLREAGPARMNES